MDCYPDTLVHERLLPAEHEVWLWRQTGQQLWGLGIGSRCRRAAIASAGYGWLLLAMYQRSYRGSAALLRSCYYDSAGGQLL